MKEGDVYTILNKAKVPNIPCCSASGDVGDDTYHSTSTDWFTNASLAVKCTHEFIPNQHHQLILDDISDKLETFQCSKEMVYTIWAALTGAILSYLLHLTTESLTDYFQLNKSAYWVCEILHCDICPNNILLMTCPDFDGRLLINWDLWKKVNPEKLTGGACQFTYMVCYSDSLTWHIFWLEIDLQGMWQFMAADLIKKPDILQTFTHDIKSMFFFLLWMALLFVNSSWQNPHTSFINDIFHPPVFGGSGGSVKAMYMQSDQLEMLKFPRNAHLTNLLHLGSQLLLFVIRNGQKGTFVMTWRSSTWRMWSCAFIPRTIRELNQLQRWQQLMDHKRRNTNNNCKSMNFSWEPSETMMSFLNILSRFLKIQGWPTNEPAAQENIILSHARKWSLPMSSKRCREATAELEGNTLVVPTTTPSEISHSDSSCFFSSLHIANCIPLCLVSLLSSWSNFIHVFWKAQIQWLDEQHMLTVHICIHVHTLWVQPQLSFFPILPQQVPGDTLKDIKGQNNHGWCHCQSEQVIIPCVLLVWSIANYIFLHLIGVSYLMTWQAARSKGSSLTYCGVHVDFFLLHTTTNAPLTCFQVLEGSSHQKCPQWHTGKLFKSCCLSTFSSIDWLGLACSFLCDSEFNIILFWW